MTKPRLIALYSSAPQSGKSTVAGYLTSKGYQIHKLAQPIKDMVIMLLMHAGFDLQVCRQMVDGDLKDTVIPSAAFQGQTPRDLQKSLGTRWGRGMIGEDCWAQLLITKALSPRDCIVVDDMRMPNEFDILRRLGALMVRIDRPFHVTLVPTETEGRLDAHDFDVVLSNDGDLSTLRDSVYKMIV